MYSLKCSIRAFAIEHTIWERCVVTAKHAFTPCLIFFSNKRVHYQLLYNTVRFSRCRCSLLLSGLLCNYYAITIKVWNILATNQTYHHLCKPCMINSEINSAVLKYQTFIDFKSTLFTLASFTNQL